MAFEAKFICCRYVEFEGNDGNIVRGYVPYVLNGDEIVKCRMRKSAMNDYHIGDDIIVNVIIHGKFVKYEIAE